VEERHLKEMAASIPGMEDVIANMLKENEKEKGKIKKELKKYKDIFSESYRLVRCASKKHKNHNMWERNMNASKNMIEIMRNLLVKKDKGKYKKKTKEEKEKEKNQKKEKKL
jgi:hypothetical protein